MGTNYYLIKNRPSVDGGFHIGKSSAGWRFLFRKPRIWECGIPLNTFEQWKGFLKESTESGDYVIMTECDNIVSYEDFISLVESKQALNRLNMFEYCENVNGYRFCADGFSQGGDKNS